MTFLPYLNQSEVSYLHLVQSQNDIFDLCGQIQTKCSNHFMYKAVYGLPNTALQLSLSAKNIHSPKTKAYVPLYLDPLRDFNTTLESSRIHKDTHKPLDARL